MCAVCTIHDASISLFCPAALLAVLHTRFGSISLCHRVWIPQKTVSKCFTARRQRRALGDTNNAHICCAHCACVCVCVCVCRLGLRMHTFNSLPPGDRGAVSGKNHHTAHRTQHSTARMHGSGKTVNAHSCSHLRENATIFLQRALACRETQYMHTPSREHTQENMRDYCCAVAAHCICICICDGVKIQHRSA